MSEFKVAAQLYTIRDFMQTKDDVEKSLKKISDIGFKTVQLSGTIGASISEVKEILDFNGLDVCCTHTSYDALKNDLEDVIKNHKTLGCNVVGLGMMPHDLRFSKEGYEEFVKFANVVNSRLKQEDMIFAYHNHAFEFMRYNDIMGMDMIVDETDIGFIPDVYWLQFAGLNPSTYLEKMGSRVKCCHFKDMKIVDFEQRFAELGQGNIDFYPILKTLQKTNVNCIAIEQDNCYESDPFDSLKISFDHITQIIKSV